MRVSNREREKVVSISRTANDRQGRVSGKNVLLALACSQEVHKYGFFLQVIWSNFSALYVIQGPHFIW